MSMVGIFPTFGMAEDRGTNWFQFVYRRRSNALAYGLDYDLELNPDLAVGSWTNEGYVVTGIGPAVDGFETVTNRVPAESTSNQFVRLVIQAE